MGNEQGEAMHEAQTVADMSAEILARQAEARAIRSGEPFEEALKAVLQTEAGRQLGELRDGPHRDERAEQWQEDLARPKGDYAPPLFANSDTDF